MTNRNKGPADRAIAQDHHWHAKKEEAVLVVQQSHLDGLSPDEAARRLRLHGPNVLERNAGENLLFVFWRQINNPIGWLLLLAALLAVLLRKYTDATVVFGAVFVNAVIGFLQEYRAGKAIEALSAMVPETAQVLRGGHPASIPAAELVPGDIVTLQSGDRVSADMRLLRLKNLLVEEAALTGESLPSAKRTEVVSEQAALGDRFNMVYGGTLVLQGTATGVVIATGGRTELGRIQELLNEAPRIETPLTRQLARVSLWITLAVVVLAAIFLLFGIFIKGAPVGEAIMVAITLAVAAIPEGLPAVITIALAIGVRRMAARHAIVRHLPAVETLGSTSVICSDKTGTLTRNEMTVQVAWVSGREYRFSGIGYAPEGEVDVDGVRQEIVPDELRDLLRMAVLCSDATVKKEEGVWIITGDPTEAALVVAGQKAGMEAHTFRQKYPRQDVLPFESETKFMATLNKVDGASVVMMKGATEVLLPRCNVTGAEEAHIRQVMETYARQGWRVLAFASKKIENTNALSPELAKHDLVFAGLVGMIDPARTEAMDAIQICKRAGIIVKMITGDHPTTAQAIGRQLGLLESSQGSVLGHEMDKCNDAQLQVMARENHVFARVAPEHKIRLVRALQAQGHVVAMTGDGVNDAPALKSADIGVAMGITGTAVSKESAKVILADDNFASIAAAVEEGRRVYDNLIKSLAFVLPTNLGLAITLATAMFFFPLVTVDGVKELLMAMSPTQTLWINLVASVALSIPLAFEVIEPAAMRRKPRRPHEPVFSRFLLFRLIMVAGTMATGACGLFMWEYFRMAGPGAITMDRHALALSEAQTICVTTITFFQIFYLLHCRALKGSLLSMGFFSNPSIFVGIGVLLLLQACFTYLPPLQHLFGSHPLDAQGWLKAMLVGALILPLISLEKWARRNAPGDTTG